MGVSIGFFSAEDILGVNLEAILGRIRSFCPLTKADFPFAVAPLFDEKKMLVARYAHVGGHVPIHVDRINANQHAQELFTFVLEAENRPVLLATPASDATSKAILVPETVQAPRAVFGAVELERGRAIHFDPTAHWMGYTGFPTGEIIPDRPSALLLQVPHKRADDIAGAVETARRVIRLDERLSDLVAR